MKWFDKLERKYGRYAIQNLMKYIIIVYAVGFVIQIFYPAVYEVYFALDAQAILHGQIWRIFTFILPFRRILPRGAFFFSESMAN